MQLIYSLKKRLLIISNISFEKKNPQFNDLQSKVKKNPNSPWYDEKYI